MISKFREPVSGFTHMFGAIASLIGMVILIVISAYNKSTIHVVTFAVFGVSLILLYSASSVYHLVILSEKTINILRKLDHSMIYVLIAGTYTPICLIALKGSLGWGLFIGIWALATLGIILKLFWMEAPRWLYTLFYIFMGWISIVVISPLARVITPTGIAWLFAGGIFYTVGAVIYATKWPRIKSKVFGFHEIFHIFVLMGSFAHYWLMLRYLMNIG
jgi:hemolysin III